MDINDYCNGFCNLYNPLCESQPNLIQENHYLYFHGKITEINTSELNSINEEIKNIINNISKENSVDNSFIQTNITKNNINYN